MDVLPEEPGESFFGNFFSYSSYSCKDKNTSFSGILVFLHGE